MKSAVWRINSSSTEMFADNGDMFFLQRGTADYFHEVHEILATLSLRLYVTHWW